MLTTTSATERAIPVRIIHRKCVDPKHMASRLTPRAEHKRSGCDAINAYTARAVLRVARQMEANGSSAHDIENFAPQDGLEHTLVLTESQHREIAGIAERLGVNQFALLSVALENWCYDGLGQLLKRSGKKGELEPRLIRLLLDVAFDPDAADQAAARCNWIEVEHSEIGDPPMSLCAVEITGLRPFLSTAPPE